MPTDAHHRLLDGHAVARAILSACRPRIEALVEAGRRPGLGVLVVGDHPAALAGLEAHRREALRWGLGVHVERIGTGAGRVAVARALRALARRADIHGLLVPRPLPEDLAPATVDDAVPPKLDVAGCHPETLGRCWRGDPGLVPAIVGAVLHLVEAGLGPPQGREVAFVAVHRSAVLPAALLLHRRGARVLLLHPEAPDRPARTRRAHVLVVDAQRPRCIGPDDVAPGAVVIDAGVHAVVEDGRLELVGDVDFEAVRHVAARTTPVPGGVGVVAVAVVLENVVRAAEGLPRDDAPGQLPLFLT